MQFATNLWRRVKAANYEAIAFYGAAVMLAACALACFWPVVERYGEYKEERGKAVIVTAEPMYYVPKSISIEGQVKDHEDWVFCRSVDLDGLDAVRMETESLLRRIKKEEANARYNSEMDREYADKWIHELTSRVYAVNFAYRSWVIAGAGLEAVEYREANPRMSWGLGGGPTTQAVWDQLWLSFEWSWLPVGIFLLLSMFRRRLTWQQILWEVLIPWRAPLATCVWIPFALVYHKHTPIQFVIRGFQIAGGAVITLLLWFGGGQAYAQTASTKSFGRRAQVTVVEADTRSALIITNNLTAATDETDLAPELLCQPDNLLEESRVLGTTEGETLIPVALIRADDSGVEQQKATRNGWLKWKLNLLRLQAMASQGNNAKTFTPELAFVARLRQLTFTAFAFCDTRWNTVKSQQLFCDAQNTLGFASIPQVALLAEYGHSNAGWFASVGLKFNLMAVPQVKRAIGKSLRVLTVAPLFRTTGPVTLRQLLIIGRSQDLSLGGKRFAFIEGAFRFRAGPFRDYSWLDARVGDRRWPWVTFGAHYEPFTRVLGIGPRFIFK